jgi:hypothetical protein
MLNTLLPAYGPCPHFAGVCSEIRWNPTPGLKALTIMLALGFLPAVVHGSPKQEPPAEIIARADKYIVSRVGIRYFQENYTLVPEKILVSRNKEYFIYYSYKPLERIGAGDHLVFVRMFARSGYVPINYVAAFDSVGVVVEPSISRDKALEVIAVENVQYFDPTRARQDLHMYDPGMGRVPGSGNWSWYLYIPHPGEGECGTYTIVFVDAVTGQFVNAGEKHWCN